jgi:hypothetical protein
MTHLECQGAGSAGPQRQRSARPSWRELPSPLDDNGRMEGPEAIFELADPSARVQGFLVVGSTRLGPAFGGIRIRAYAHERDALVDAIDLAGTMTAKAALAGLDCGGGKIVFIDRRGFDRARAMALLGRALDQLGGRFFAGRDLGMTSADLGRLRRATRFAADESPSALGDLGEATARGTLAALCAAPLHAGSQHGAGTRIRRGPRRSRGRAGSGSARRLTPLDDLRSLARAATLAAATNGGGISLARDEHARLAMGPVRDPTSSPASDRAQGAGSVGIAIVRQPRRGRRRRRGIPISRREARCRAGDDQSPRGVSPPPAWTPSFPRRPDACSTRHSRTAPRCSRVRPGEQRARLPRGRARLRERGSSTFPTSSPARGVYRGRLPPSGAARRPLRAPGRPRLRSRPDSRGLRGCRRDGRIRARDRRDWPTGRPVPPARRSIGPPPRRG